MAYSKGHVCQCLSRILSARKNALLTIYGDRRRTRVEFVEAVLGLARGLSKLGVDKGEVVAVAALNSDVYLELILAVTFVGGIVAPLNHRWSFEEGRSALELIQPAIFVVDDNCMSWSKQLQGQNSVASLRFYILMNGGTTSHEEAVLAMDSIRNPPKYTVAEDFSWAPEEVALICFTSGTTGKPKGVVIRHSAIIIQSLAKIAVVGYGENDVHLHTTPLCHIGGLSSCLAMLMAGGCHVVTPKFDAEASLQAIEEHQVTSFITVPAIMSDLISCARKAHRWKNRSSVKKILNGGGSLSPELLNAATYIFPNAKIISAYGMTEACSSLTFMTLHDIKPDANVRPFLRKAYRKPDCMPQQRGTLVGKPAPHVELRIAGDESSRTPLRVGSIVTRGVHVMAGYWDQTVGVSLDTGDIGWLDTGDIGWLDENGDLWLVGRKKDRIKTGGENVYPEEVESVLSQHLGISNVVVVGVPDDRLGEKVVACIAIREGWDWTHHSSSDNSNAKVLSSEILQNFCRGQNLSGFKIPRNYILWKKPFPLTSTGKLKREEVMKQVLSYSHFLPSSL